MLQLRQWRITCWALWHANGRLVGAVATINATPWPPRLNCASADHGGHGTPSPDWAGLPTLARRLPLMPCRYWVAPYDVMGKWNVHFKATKIRVEGSSYCACILNFLWPISWVCVKQFSWFLLLCVLRHAENRSKANLVTWKRQCKAHLMGTSSLIRVFWVHLIPQKDNLRTFISAHKKQKTLDAYWCNEHIKRKTYLDIYSSVTAKKVFIFGAFMF